MRAVTSGEVGTESDISLDDASRLLESVFAVTSSLFQLSLSQSLDLISGEWLLFFVSLTFAEWTKVSAVSGSLFGVSSRWDCSSVPVRILWLPSDLTLPLLSVNILRRLSIDNCGELLKFRATDVDEAAESPLQIKLDLREMPALEVEGSPASTLEEHPIFLKISPTTTPERCRFVCQYAQDVPRNQYTLMNAGCNALWPLHQLRIPILRAMQISFICRVYTGFDLRMPHWKSWDLKHWYVWKNA